jgi:hypothetical protein
MDFLRITGNARLVGDPLQIQADRFSGHSAVGVRNLRLAGEPPTTVTFKICDLLFVQHNQRINFHGPAGRH